MRRSLRYSSATCDYVSPPRRNLSRNVDRHLKRAFGSTNGARQHKDNGEAPEREEKGAMSRRLQDLSDESLETSGARKAVEEAGFSEELKARLQEKIANASFKSEHASAFAPVPKSAGKGTAAIAAAQPWMGVESLADTTLRMLDDAHKPLRLKRPPTLPSIRTPKTVDTGRPASRATGARLANARDKTSVYSSLKDSSLSEEEREKYRKELKERFSSTGRAMPSTIQGLQSLANERIEDAIARGLFKNIPRGKAIERDHNASNPFLDTTEYFMNKLIQKQEIVPPWIEKQQELVATASRFRGQLRATWRRHVARTIASRGGSLSEQIKTANEFAAAESPPTVKTSPGTEANHQLQTGPAPLDAEADHKSQISLSGQLDVIVDSAVTGQTADELPPVESSVFVRPFRDPQWEATERSYHTLAIENLNSLTRSYNLMAPDLAKKPYFSLARELNSCFAEVAPQVADEIRQRALTPRLVEVVGHKPGGVMDKFAMDKAAHVYDEQKPQYGFKEFWRDLFSK